MTKQQTVESPKTAPSSLEQAKENKKLAQKVKRNARKSKFHWRGWKEIFLAGTEWDIYKNAYDIDWDFDHLKAFLRNQQENPASTKRSVFCFGGTEPQMLYNGQSVVIPFIAVVVGDRQMSPPDHVGVTSVQRVKEDILPMSHFNMDWIPQFDITKDSKGINEVYFMQCRTRHARTKYMKEMEKMEYTYLIPHMIRPDSWMKDLQKPDGIPPGTSIKVEGIPKALEVAYMPSLYESLDEYVEELCEEQKLDLETFRPILTKALKDEMQRVQDAYETELKEKKEMLDRLSPEQKEALRNCQLLKFYPQNEEPPIEPWKNALINRYYGRTNTIY